MNATKTDRIRSANALLLVIASVGRQFFRHGDRVAHIERDLRGRYWFHDAYTDRLVYMHGPHALGYNFTGGGTMRCLSLALKEFAQHGKKVNPRTFGPWPDWYCGGDLWGYGDAAMALIRSEASRLGITEDPPRCTS